MKILVTHASVGAGHEASASAIYDYFKQRKPQLDIKIIDVLEYSHPLFKYCYIGAYSFLITYAPSIWKLGFLLTGNKYLRPFTWPIISALDRLNTRRLRRLLIQDSPDIIISTHFLSSQICAGLKKSGKIKSKLATVITDYAIHPLWLSHRTDYYIVALGVTKQLLIREGVRENIIKDMGIPVSPKFSARYEKAGLLQKLGLEKNKFTVLVVTGSFGVGPIRQIVNLLYKDAQLLVVCAKNKKLYRKLKEKNFSGVRIYGYVDNMQELMYVSDMIVTKPGGLTISEILNMELIPVFIYPIPGQETGNVSVLKKYGVGLSPRNIKEIRNIVLDLKLCPD